MKYRVKRTFPNSLAVKVGDEVDASMWRNRAMLERQGYIESVEETAGGTANKLNEKNEIENKAAAAASENEPDKLVAVNLTENLDALNERVAATNPSEVLSKPPAAAKKKTAKPKK